MPDDRETCRWRLDLGVERRPANALNIEIGQPLTRCKLKQPSHWRGSGASPLRWLASGGSPLVFGICSSACPEGSEVGRVKDAIEAGRILHAEHPDFGGVLTVGPNHDAIGGDPWAIVHHGGRVDVGMGAESAIAAARSFCFQVGRGRARDAVVASWAKDGL